MAETQAGTGKTQAGTEKNAPETQPPAYQKRPLGRPVGTKAVRAPDGGIVTKDDADDFFTYLRSFPASEWEERLLLYLYRTHPFIDLGKKGEWRIERYNKAVDSQDVMLAHGSGGYKMLLIRWDPATNESKLIRTHYFTIMNMNYPPRVGLGPWIDKEENRQWLWAKAALQEQLRTPANNVTDQGALLKQVVDIVRDLSPNQNSEEQTTLAQLVIQTMQESNKQMLALANPSQMVTLIKEILTGNNRDESKSPLFVLLNGQLESIRAELAEERKFNRELLAKLSSPETKKSLKEELLEVKEVGDLIGIGGRAARSQATDWGDVARDVGKDAMRALTAIGTAMLNRTPVPRGHQPAATSQPQLPAAAADTAKPTNTPVAEEEKRQDMVQQISNQFGGLFDAATPFLVDHFIKGFSGMEFREWFLETYGTYTYSAIKAMSKETLAAVIELRKQQAPEHVASQLQQLAPPDKLLTFIAEFLSDAPADDDEEEHAATVNGAPGGPPATRLEPFRDHNAAEEF